MRAQTAGSMLFSMVTVALTGTVRPAHAAESGGESSTPLLGVTPGRPAPVAAQAAQPPAGAPVETLELPEEEAALEAGSPLPVAPRHRPSRKRARWYGWQTLLADAGSVPFFLATVQSLGGYSLVPYVALGPSIHFAHDNVAIGFASLGTRVVLPVAGAATGILLGSATGACERSGSSEDEGWAELGCVLGSGVIGWLAGMTGAIVIDSAVLAYERDTRRASGARGGFRLAPSVAYDGRKASVALTGSF